MLERLMFRNILVAVDGSAPAELAMRHAIELAVSGHSRLTLLTAVAPPRRLASWGLAVTGMISVLERAEAEAEKIAQRARDSVPRDVPVAGVVAKQAARHAILQQITDGHHDLVVMGSRGGGIVRSAILGGVSHYIMQHSPVPVLIVSAEAIREHQPVGSVDADGASALGQPEASAGAP
jgi:nucleotide-binding universal stress UspA family protein